MHDGSCPDASLPSRRTVLRSLLGGSIASLVAGCNTSGGDPTETGDATTAADSPAGSSPAPTAPSTPLPTATLSPTPIPPTGPTGTAPGSPTASPTSTQAPSLSADARTFVGHLDAGEYESAREMLSAQAAGQLSAATLEQLWLGLTAQHGEFQAVADEERTTSSGFPAVDLTLRCAEGEQRALFTFQTGTIAGLQFPGEYSPPDYADRSSFTERSVTVEAEGCSLPGTLSVPGGEDGTPADGGTPTGRGTPTGDGASADTDGVPGVVLVHGSGPNDRDSTIGPNKPLKDVAWGLASRGVAVLRYDKRTAACDVPLANWSIDNVVVDDAVRALERLGEVERVDTDRRFVVGHSLGAVCTPRIAANAEGLAGGAMLAANARQIIELIRYQYQYLLSVDGELTADEESRLESIRAAMTRVENGEVAPDETILGLPGSWYASLLDYDQVGTARDVALPLFFLQGGRDYQVPPDPEFQRWRDALADREATSFELYPELSHLFQPGAEPSLGTEYQFHDNVAESVVADLADWIHSTGA